MRAHRGDDAEPTGPAARSPHGGRAAASGALAVALVLGRADAPLLGALAGGIRADLWVTDTQLGALAAAVALARAAALPTAARLAARHGPARLLPLALALAGAALLIGAASPLLALLAAACLALGAGRAAPGALAPAVASALRPVHRPGRAAALVAAALPAGAALGYALATLAPWLGWRAPLAAAGALALAAAAALALLRGPVGGAAARAGAAAPSLAPPPPGGAAALAAALRALRPPEALALAARMLLASCLGALLFWAPAFLERARGLPPGVAAAQLAAIVVMAGLGAPAATRLLSAAPARLGAASAGEWPAAAACLLAAPLGWAAVVSPSPAIYLPALAFALLLLLSALPRPMPSRPDEAAGLGGLGGFGALVAGGAAPAAVGALSELTNLYWAFLAVPAAALLAGAAFAAAGYAGRSR